MSVFLRLLFTLVYVHMCTANDLIITDFLVPKVIPQGTSDLGMECRYRGSFSSLTWFKGSSKFLQYRPDEVPAIQLYQIPGVGAVEVIDCGENVCKIWLSSLTDDVSGIYKCVLEQEGRPGKFAIKTANLAVKGESKIEGLAQEYGQGDEIEASCQGRPGSQMRWYTNGHEVKEARGSPVLRAYSLRAMFIGSPPTLTIECAEYHDGYILSNKKGKVNWRKMYSKNPDYDSLAIPAQGIAVMDQLSLFAMISWTIFFVYFSLF